MPTVINCDKCGVKIADHGSRTWMYVCTKCASRFCGNSCGQSTCPDCKAKTERKAVSL
jgi:hypothetical protein